MRQTLLGVLAVSAACTTAATQPPASATPTAVTWVTPAVTGAGVSYQLFASSAARATVSYHVYLPPQYTTAPTQRFPVLYWLHGTGGGLGGIAPLSAHFDAAIRAGTIPPMLVVFANGMASSMWANSLDGRVPMETVVTRDVVDDVDARFRTVATRDGRLLEGFSMGGYGAARLGMRGAERFGAVSMLAGGPIDLDFNGPRARANPAERDRIFREVFGNDLAYYRALSPLTVAEAFARAAGPRPRLRIAVGTLDDTRDASAALHERFTALGVAHEFVEVPGVGHDTMALLRGLGEMGWAFYRMAAQVPASARSGAP
jgi:enterochelin esterase-like enzyme